MSTATVTPDTTVRDSAPDTTTSSERRALSAAPAGLRAALVAVLIPVYYLALTVLPDPGPTAHTVLRILFAVSVAVFAFLAFSATGRFDSIAAPARGAYLALSGALVGIGTLAVTSAFAWVHWLIGAGIHMDRTWVGISLFEHLVVAAIHVTALVLVARIVLPRRGSK